MRKAASSNFRLLEEIMIICLSLISRSLERKNNSHTKNNVQTRGDVWQVLKRTNVNYEVQVWQYIVKFEMEADKADASGLMITCLS
jgi:hypothetical protein